MKVTKENEYDVINFTNIDSGVFVGKWGGKEESFEAGETRPLPRFKAVHYAKQLSKEIMRRETGEPFSDEKQVEEHSAKIFGEVVTAPAPTEPEPTSAEPEFEEAKTLEVPKEEKAAEPEEEVKVKKPRKTAKPKAKKKVN